MTLQKLRRGLSVYCYVFFFTGGPLTEQNPPAVPGTIGEILTVGGEFNRWLNLTGVEVAGGARDPDRYIFMCEVCVGRGTQFEECHIANYTNLVIGSPPRIVSEPCECHTLSI